MTPGHSILATLLCLVAFLLSVALTIPKSWTLSWMGALILACTAAAFNDRNMVYDFSVDDTAAMDSLVQATNFIQTNNFRYPMAGCGFYGYPRHLEYMLNDSLNFMDCYDMIVDGVKLDEAAYIANNTFDTAGLMPLQDFYQKAGKMPIEYQFTWEKAPGFVLVMALPSMQLDPYIGQIVEACKHNVLYQNDQVLIIECSPDNIMKKIIPNKIMLDIVSMQRWYKTRINPYEGRSFKTFR
jgi:hypothetical protein